MACSMSFTTRSNWSSRPMPFLTPSRSTSPASISAPRSTWKTSSFPLVPRLRPTRGISPWRPSPPRRSSKLLLTPRPNRPPSKPLRLGLSQPRTFPLRGEPLTFTPNGPPDIAGLADDGAFCLFRSGLGPQGRVSPNRDLSPCSSSSGSAIPGTAIGSTGIMSASSRSR
ncbi:hypothetical protein CHELA1G2_13223 [Hyphomicrobiales bacterium]|nr:hypothetical protein CHELA1G2_13223 [Hyphomicrobiales bacterium]